MSLLRCPLCDGYFDPDLGECSNLDGREPCGYRPPDPEPVPPAPRENFDRHVADTTLDDRDALAVMPTERVREVHRPGIAEARRALAEAAHRKSLPKQTRDLVLAGRDVVDVDTGDVL